MLEVKDVKMLKRNTTTLLEKYFRGEEERRGGGEDRTLKKEICERVNWALEVLGS